jgi:hypothetical protein
MSSPGRLSVPGRALLLAVATTLAVGLLPARAQAPQRPAVDFVGLVAEDAFAGPDPYRKSTLRRQRAIGANILRQTFDWAVIERTPNRYRFRKYDRFVLHASHYGMRLLPILFNPPGWHSSRPARNARHGTYPPKDPAAFGAFAAALVRRYGPDGTLWRDFPRARKLPIKSWQVWNEPNLPVYWASGPDPEEFVEMMRAVNAAIKEEDPTAEVVTAGIPQSKLGIPMLTYIRRMYAKGAAGTFDTLAVNPYARTAHLLRQRLRAVRRIMNGRDDTENRIWITELGWSDVGPYSPFRVGPEGQARRIAQAFEVIRQERRRLKLRGVIYTFWRDGRPYPPKFTDFWGLHTGLLRLDGKPKKAYAAFKRAVQRVR